MGVMSGNAILKNEGQGWEGRIITRVQKRKFIRLWGELGLISDKDKKTGERNSRQVVESIGFTGYES